jgi:hypothetical protein
MRSGEGVDTVDLHKFQVTQRLIQLRAKRGLSQLMTV